MLLALGPWQSILLAMPTSLISAEAIKEALRCGRSGCSCARGPNVHCPNHDDRHASFTIHESDGKILLNCKTGCSQKDVIEALKGRGLWTTHEPDRQSAQDNGRIAEKPVAIYEYKDASGTVLAMKGRFEYGEGKKAFKWKLPGADSWQGLGSIHIADLPLWGVDLLVGQPASPVYFVEGEKAVLSCQAESILAVTHAGGASTIDFGQSLHVLRGRHVFLWPDNDEAGRRYMARVHAVLRPLAKSITVLTPPVSEKGDAYDYFEGGGTLAALLQDAPPTHPAIDYLAHDALRVRMPTTLGIVAFAFSHMEKTARELQAEVEVEFMGTGGEPYSQRLNLLSGPAVTEMRRTLDSIYGKDIGWAPVVNTAIARARKGFLEQDRANRFINVADPGKPLFLIPELLQADVANVWFGNGSSMKTYLALLVATCIAAPTPFMGRPVKHGGVLLVDYENDASNWRFRLGRILQGLKLALDQDYPLEHWDACGIPLVDQIEGIREKVLRSGTILVIIDSAAAACGGKPEDADITLSFFRALAKLGQGVTVLVIAHCTKGSDEMNPFGSIFWTNQPRRTVNMSRTTEEDSDDMDIGIFVRKVNEGRRPKPSAFHVHFDGEDGPVEITRTDIATVPELNKKRHKYLRIWDILLKPMSTGNIASLLGEGFTADSVGALCRNYPKLFFQVNVSDDGQGVWSRKTKEEERPF